MGTLATLYGLARLNKRKPFLQLYTANFLRQYFQINLPVTLKLWEKNKKLSYHNIGTFIQSRDVTLAKDVVILRGYKFPNSPTFYDFVRYEIKEQFRFIDSIDEYAESVLHQIQQTRSVETFIGIHVRRTDMVKVMKRHKSFLPGSEYFNKSMDYFLSRYQNVAFVVASDDRKWCQENLIHPNLVIAPHPPSPAHDMAVLSKCNHSIITVGTFGTWAAYLAGGETIYFKAFPPKHPYLKSYPYEYMYLPEWTGMS
ncbi:galactoside 2-alpha-L-fucosyltransferase 2-like [Limulus polyphemus]|uniref:L-Fucosyltransferase n=1 Tax=Limulus polyphemus TaxID=6850 RepID=A0ABM1B164_LIMPO|nr:galactoside 2-alpha-L-fucosyltransferase 2-like [Limulus polyphemus]